MYRRDYELFLVSREWVLLQELSEQWVRQATAFDDSTESLPECVHLTVDPRELDAADIMLENSKGLLRQGTRFIP